MSYETEPLSVESLPSTTNLTDATAGTTVFQFRNFDIEFRNHSYIAPVVSPRLYLHSDGLWYLGYRLVNCQWQGLLSLTARFFAGTEQLHEESNVDFLLKCHIAVYGAGGTIPERFFNRVNRVNLEFATVSVRVC